MSLNDFNSLWHTERQSNTILWLRQYFIEKCSIRKRKQR